MKLLSELKLFWFTFDDNMRRALYNHLQIYHHSGEGNLMFKVDGYSSVKGLENDEL